MTRRSFIQRFVYSLLVMFFGPGILEQLDVEATERVIDEVAASAKPAEPILDTINRAVTFSFDGLFARDVQ